MPVRLQCCTADKLADGSTVLEPTNTFHVGFWFNNPEDAVPCGFNAAMRTPFNGEHKAGPLAMISLPDATTGLGPLCTSPTGGQSGLAVAAGLQPLNLPGSKVQCRRRLSDRVGLIATAGVRRALGRNWQ